MTSEREFKIKTPEQRQIKELTINAFLTRLFLFSVLPLILLALILAGVHAWSINSNKIDDAKNQLHNVVAAVDRDLRARISALNVLSESPFLDDPIQLEVFNKEANSFRKNFPGHIVLADLSTQMLLNTRVRLGGVLPELPVPEGFAAAPYVMKYLKPAVGDSFIGPIANKKLVAVVVPVLRQKKIKATLLSIVDAGLYQGILDEMSISPDYSLTLFDSGEAIIASRAGLHPSTGFLAHKQFSGNSQISGWSVVLSVSNTVFYKHLMLDGFVLVLAILIAFSISVLGGKMFSRRFSRSFESLADKSLSTQPAQRISEIENAREQIESATKASRKSEDDLRRSEELYRSLFEAANVGKSITLPNGEVNTNKALANMLGYRQEEMHNKTWQQLTPAEDIEPVQKILDTILRGEKNSARFTKRYIHKNGSHIWADVNVALQRDIKGEPLYFITNLVDITELRLSEKNLVDAENRYRTLFENMTAGFVLFEVIQDDAGSPVDLVILAANKIFETTVGLQLKDVVGKQLTQALPGIEKDAADWVGTYGSVALTGESVQFEQASDLLGNYYSIMAFQARPKQCAVTFVDITERKEAEAEARHLQDQLRQAQRIEAVGSLAGGVAHDYNNMLSVILGYTELALQAVQPQSELHNDLTEVYKAAKRSTEITRQLLAFARKQTIEAVVLNLNDVIDGMLKMIRRLIGEDIDLAWHPCCDLWPVSMDPSQIDQILVNLAVNARDAIADVGKITIETSNITLDEMYCSKHAGFVPGDFVLFAVSDNGCGIKKKNIDKIFDPFFTTKALGKGTGLGLSTVYGIVKQNKGFINVYSEYGEGTTFKIYLKRHLRDLEETGTQKDEEYHLSQGETILVVEDDSSILNLCRRMLKDLEYSVLTANTPEKAIHLARSEEKKIHLLMTDVIMPEMNGKELAKRIQEFYPDIKVLFMSGYTANVIAHHGVLEKGIHFVSKPLCRKVLATKIREALG